MIAWLKRLKRDANPRRTLEIGWVVDWAKGGLIFEAPRPYVRKAPAPPSAKAVGYCPAVLDHEARFFEIPCPLDMHMRLGKDERGQLRLEYVTSPASSVGAKYLAPLVTLNGPNQWREPGRPVLQIAAPYRFVSDEPAWLMQMPPIFHHRREALPGVMIGGRFPTHVWPRILMWAFEWHDPSADLILRRGEPWFYVRFETGDPTRPVRLIEAAMTDDLRRYCDGMDGVVNYVNRTFSLFPTAARRRPPRLLMPAPRTKDPG
jgi:hypothetical protein